MRSRVALVALLLLSLLLGACTWATPSDPDTWQGQVGDAEVRAVVGETVVVFPVGVAPAGTRARVQKKPTDGGHVPRTEALSETVEVTLEGGAQPAHSITLTMPVVSERPARELAEKVVLFVAGVADDGTQTYDVGRFDEKQGTYTVTVDHLTRFTVFGVDVGKAFDEVRTTIMQGLGVEYPEPDCVGEPGRVGEVTYEVASSAVAYLCLSEDAGNLVVTAHPATGMPYLVTTTPRSTAQAASTEVSAGTAGMIAVAKGLHLLEAGGKGAVFPGGISRFVLAGAPTTVSVDLEQYPVMLLMAILAKTVDVLDVVPIGRLADLQCLVDVAGYADRLGQGISGEAVGAAMKSFFSCVETVAEVTRLGKVILAALSSGVAFLTSGVVGIINEFTGQARVHVDLTVSVPAGPRATIALEEGGAIVIDGEYRRGGGPENIAFLTRALGEPVSTRTVRCSESLELMEREWRGLTVYSLMEPYTNELGTIPAGGIAGWRFRGAPQSWRITGPQGIGIGTPAAEVERLYADSSFSMWREGTWIKVFAGDTTNAEYKLDGSDRVQEIHAGWTCNG